MRMAPYLFLSLALISINGCDDSGNLRAEPDIIYQLPEPLSESNTPSQRVDDEELKDLSSMEGSTLAILIEEFIFLRNVKPAINQSDINSFDGILQVVSDQQSIYHLYFEHGELVDVKIYDKKKKKEN